VRKSLFVAAWTALFAVPASAVTIVWVPIGNPGNPGDAPVPTKCYVPDCGSVAYDYRISRYETTNAQYAEFLNAVDVEGNNTLELYNASMDTDPTFGGISRVPGNAPGSRYVVKPGFEDQPVTYVSFYDALRFANWMSNGQGSGDTETGAYTLLGGTANPSNGLTVARNAGANVFLTSENEWYKAAYYSPGGVYFDYPTETDTPTGCVAPSADTGNSANCDDAGDVLTDVGAYGLSRSPYGTYDQGGNVSEWNESIVVGTRRGFRGGGWGSRFDDLRVDNPYDSVPISEFPFVGFRVAPEASAQLLGVTAIVCLALQRRRVAETR
jgi:formylglycine-generating enzyme required for sulfatase activity